MQRFLTDAQVNQFLTRGHIVLRQCFDPQEAQRRTQQAWARLGYDPLDRSTWAESRIHMPSHERMDVSEFAPDVWRAACELLGGEDRVATPYRWGDGFIVNLRDGADQPWQPASPQVKGWHKDGDFFLHFLDSPEQGLLTIVLWSDVVHQAGPTYIACDSVPVVARFLAERPQGVEPGQFDCQRLVAQCSDFAEATGKAGDVYLMHPYMLHASSQNILQRPRFITNPPVHLKEPMNFNRAEPADFSPVEQGVLRGLGVDRLNFQPVAERRRIVPERVLRQHRMLEEEKARLGAQTKA